MKKFKIVLLGLLVLFVNSCANNMVQGNSIAVAKPLPTKCGDYDIIYGNVDAHGVFRKFDGTVVKLLSGLDSKNYSGEKIVLSGKYWVQRGGLLNPDGSDTSFAVNNLIDAAIVQVVESGFDDEIIEEKCKTLKEKK